MFSWNVLPTPSAVRPRWCRGLIALALLLCGICFPCLAIADDADILSPNGSDVDALAPLPTDPAGGTNPVTVAGNGVPISQVPQLSSLPSSPTKSIWTLPERRSTPGPVTVRERSLPYDQDGDPTTFSHSEIQSIDQILARVSENYSPFNVDVTTIDPGSYGTNQAVRVVISGSGTWYGTPAGGISQVGSFNNAGVNANTNGTVFVFPGYLANGTAKYVGIASSHEAGHAFGLVHQEYSGNRPRNMAPAPGRAIRAHPFVHAGHRIQIADHGAGLLCRSRALVGWAEQDKPNYPVTTRTISPSFPRTFSAIDRSIRMSASAPRCRLPTPAATSRRRASFARRRINTTTRSPRPADRPTSIWTWRGSSILPAARR